MTFVRCNTNLMAGVPACFTRPRKEADNSQDRQFEQLIENARKEVMAVEKSHLRRKDDMREGSFNQDGHDGALSALLCHVWPRLLGYTRKLACNEDLAQDVAQDTMVKIITGIQAFQPERGSSGFMSWVFTIATNVYRDRLRRYSRSIPVADAGGLLEKTAPESYDPTHDESEWDTILSILKDLPQEQRIALVLRTYYSYSYREIAEIMRCPEGTVKSRVHTAVLNVRQQLKRRGML